jgi:hypothetical protein
MKYFASTILIVFAFFSNLTASADTLVEGFQFFPLTGTLMSAGTITISIAGNTGGGTIIGATGFVDGDSVIGGSGAVFASPQRYFVTLNLSDGGIADFTNAGDETGRVFNAAGAQTDFSFGELRGVGGVSPVPLPASGPMFAMALLALGAFCYLRSKILSGLLFKKRSGRSGLGYIG